MRLPAVLSALSVVAFVATGSTNCDSGGQCECIPCTSAINLQVFDENDNALGTGWSAEATVDGAVVNDIVNCDESTRFGNSCDFGQETGIYRITIRAAGFLTKQIAARFAAKSGEDCCVCLQATAVHAVLLADPDGGT
jgi:hypothetical protein